MTSKSTNGSSSPRLYLTPQLAKRKDGLAPSLFDMKNDTSNMEKSMPYGAARKWYRTNSSMLLQVEEPRAVFELQTLTEAIHTALSDLDELEIDFQPKGCVWTCRISDEKEEVEYYIQVTNKANDVHGETNYLVDAWLLPDKELASPAAPPLQGYKVAKVLFDTVALKVRKAVVRIQFPEFPEGCKEKPFREVYQLNARLKSGSFATVCRGTHRATGRKVAIKCVLRKDLPPADDAAIYDEVAILASLNHPHIVPLIDFFDEKDCYFIVMELMSGGDLFDRIGKKKTYSEADARDLVVKMLKAVAYCHSRHIAHCDMKPKNLLLMSDDNDSFIKLADFGFAARVHEPKSLTKQCGTPFFVSPEILMRKGYDTQSDMWSVGCIVFLLLSGNLPFMGRSQKELFRKIVAGKYEFDDEDWKDVSSDAKDLVKRLLVLNPDDRITAAEAVRHRWLKTSKDRLSLISLQGTSQRLKTFNAKMKLRSAMIAIDWATSLKRMQFISSRSMDGSDLDGTGDSTRNLIKQLSARKMTNGQAASAPPQKEGPPKKTPRSREKKKVSSPTKAMKKMTVS